MALRELNPLILHAQELDAFLQAVGQSVVSVGGGKPPSSRCTFSLLWLTVFCFCFFQALFLFKQIIYIEICIKGTIINVCLCELLHNEHRS